MKKVAEKATIVAQNDTIVEADIVAEMQSDESDSESSRFGSISSKPFIWVLISLNSE